MEIPVRKQSPYVRYTILVAVLGVFLWTYFQEKKPRVETGTLEYRMVTGVNKGNFQLIVMEIPESFIIPDSAYRKVFDNSQAELVSRPLQVKMMETFQNIEYKIGINEESSRTKPTYRVTREVFNSVRFGVPLKYEIDKKQKDGIIKLVE